MFTYSVEAKTFEALKAQIISDFGLDTAPEWLSRHAEANIVQAPVHKEAVDPAPPKRTRRTKAEIEAAKQVEAPVVEEEKEYSADDCRALLKKIIATDDADMTAARNLLSKFNVKKVAELQPHQYPEFVLAAGALV